MQINGNYFRRKRLARFMRLVSEVGPAPHVLDVGGTPEYWRALEPMWKGRIGKITIVNLDAPEADFGDVVVRPGNACNLSEFADDSFDLVHSNSVIEHVGRYEQMSQMASEVRRLAPAYYLQTPYAYFPIEPHYRAPFVHWLAPETRAKILMKVKLGFMGRYDTFEAAMKDVDTIHLLNLRQMRALFPDATIEHERLLGLTKSVVCVRSRRAVVQDAPAEIRLAS